ncbi:ribosome biogenesis GTPase YlqF [Oculatella sp. LEGE 06141]|uniref:ribosome biogenesis GTPase YlqF n=1 Tax=Oculatella sp. LEGE 06141 TaxID=1828648 RepID=UPI00187E4834|nr:ribosome biogenesis GTPase YlqF [Oculatella sp. LEGE 06141]MBE9177303.1 ribosome biogenesis GTPase YlqF [Oculatella sp. LEGE 06141]
MTSPRIQWYPGHIAKAEKQLVEQLKKVDVVLEVRDARIPLATHHPRVNHWVGSKERVLVLNRMDMIPASVKQAWMKWFVEQGSQPYFTNANHGQGVADLAQATHTAGDQMNQRRRDRGMLPRPVRAVVIGFPNVGKSALINRLLNRRVVDSARRPGVTRQLRWIRISDQLELLDAPGVLPAQLDDQDAALKLAICDDIGEAAYDNQRVAAALVDMLNRIQAQAPEMMPVQPLTSRYGVDTDSISGELYLATLAEQRFNGDIERAARQLLNDFRKGLMGAIPLELPLS